MSDENLKKLTKDKDHLIQLEWLILNCKGICRISSIIEWEKITGKVYTDKTGKDVLFGNILGKSRIGGDK